MNVGITYDLKSHYLQMGYTEEETAEFDKEDTIDAIEKALQDLNYSTERIGNIDNLIKDLVKGKKWDIVFNIAEGMHGMAREAQIPALLDAYKIPYTFSDPVVLSVSLHKGMTKHIINNLKIPTANFFVIEYEEDAEKVNLKYPLFIKPIAEGTSKGVTDKSKVENFEQLKENSKILLEKYKQAVLVEEYLPGREFTVGMIGTGKKARVIGIMEIILKNNADSTGYSYINKVNYEKVIEYRVVTEEDIIKKCSKVCLDAWRGLGCRDGGRVDIKFDSNEVPNFIEVNPLAGLHPKNSDLPILSYKVGIEYKSLIEEIMNSAIQRV